MRIKGYRIWIIMVIPVLIIGWLLFSTVEKNKHALKEQSIRSLMLAKNNFLQSWKDYEEQLTHQLDLQILVYEVLHPDSLETELFKALYKSDTINITQIWNKAADTIGIKDNRIITRFSYPIQIEDSLLKRKWPNDTITFKLNHPVDSLFKYNESTEFFDHVALLKNDGTVIYQSNDLPVTNLDFQRLYPDSLRGVINSEIAISPHKYYTYTLPLKIVGETLYLTGLINAERFKSASRKLSFTWISALILIISLLVASYPIIKVIGLSSGDFLVRTHVYQVGLSLLFVGIILGIAGSFMMTRTAMQQINKEDLDALVDSVQHDHKLYTAKSSEMLSCCKRLYNAPDFNEIIKIEETGKIQDVDLGHGKIFHNLSVLNLKKRDYFQQADTASYFISSHFSYNSGKPEGVISIKDNGIVNAVTYNFNSLDRQEPSFNKLGIKYLLIKPDGKVYYQSPNIETYLPELKEGVGDKQWKEIEALINNNATIADAKLKIPVFLNGHNYMARLEQIKIAPDDKPLSTTVWILTFSDENLLHLRNFFIMVNASMGFGVMLITLTLLLIIGYLSRKTSFYLNLNEYPYSWFRPSLHNRMGFIILASIIVIHIICLLWLFYGNKNNFILLALVCSEFMVFIELCKYVLLAGVIERYNKNSVLGHDHLNIWFNGLLAIAIGIITWTTCLNTDKSDPALFWLLIIHGILIIVLWIYSAKIFVKEKNNRCKQFDTADNAEESQASATTKRFIYDTFLPPKTVFSLTFSLWILGTGILPGLAIHHSAAHYENKVWTLAKKNDNLGSDTCKTDFFTAFEYQRRQLFKNYTDIDNKFVDHYLSANKETLEAAFRYGNEAEDHRVHHRIWHTLGCLLALFVLYLTVVFLSRRIFLTEYWNLEELNKDFTPEKENLIKLSNLYCVALDNDKVTEFWKENIKNQVNIFNLITSGDRERLANLTQKAIENLDVILIMNVQCFMAEENIGKLTTIMGWCKELNKRVIMTSSMSLTELDLTITKNEKITPAMHLGISEAFSFFTTVIFPIDHGVKKPDADTDEYRQKLEFDAHFGHGEQDILQLKNAKIFSVHEYEKRLLEIEQVNAGYYLNIWHELSFKEQQMVYNQATEGFVNYTNIDILTGLIRKGVFGMNRHKDKIVLFNRSFRNFVTTAPSAKLMKDFEKDSKENGNVSNLRNAILTFVFLIVFAVSLFDVTIFNDITTIVSGALAAVSTLASVFGNFSGKWPFGKKEG